MNLVMPEENIKLRQHSIIFIRFSIRFTFFLFLLCYFFFFLAVCCAILCGRSTCAFYVILWIIGGKQPLISFTLIQFECRVEYYFIYLVFVVVFVFTLKLVKQA